MYSLKKVFLKKSLILLVSIFCVANISFSEEIKKGTKTILTKDQQILLSMGTKNVFKGPVILLRLGSTHFDPLQGLPASKAGVNAIQSYDNKSLGYYIVQFDGPILNSWKNQLKEAGAEIFDYVPDFAFIIRVSPDKKQEIESFEHVRWIGIYQTSFRISQDAVNKIHTADHSVTEDAQDSSQDILLRITVFPGEDLERVKSDIKALDCIILEEVTTSWKTSFKVKVSPNKIEQLPLIPGIKWIEPTPEWELFNNIGTDIMGVRTPRDTNGLYGSGQTVGVCDTGLDQGNTSPATLHDDFENGSGVTRVLQIIDVAGDGATSDVNSGHGTHVAGSVLGNGKNSGSTPSTNTFPTNCFAGTAPKANLVFQASEDNATKGLVLPTDLNTLFAQSNAAGADLHTNSWGSSQGSKYTSTSQDVDEYVWNNKDFFILFSAGNSGVDLDGNGVIDQYSIGAPATAKNCLTVGASENNRPAGAGFDWAWGYGWPNDYSAAPISTDHLSDDPTGMAAFSSRGPVLDGRYKPDIVAPGTNILSTRSSQIPGTSNGWGAYDANYMYNGGTSMSTPLTAGAAALMREYLIKKGLTNPSAALIKAALLNSAESISPGQYGTGVYREIPASPVPNNVTGWGRLNIENGVYPATPFNIKYFDEQTGLNTAAFKEYSVTVSAATSPLKINLAWSDYPGLPAAQGGLVNDLDLQITNPSSTVIYPDNASKKPTVSTLDYNDGNGNIAASGKFAVRFTPSSYPANLDTTSFWVYNPTSSTDDITVVVYANDNSGLPGGTILYTKTLTYADGWVTLGITGVVINSGDFFISVEHSGGTKLVQDNTDLINPGRSYYSAAAPTNWFADIGYASYIQATTRGADYSTQFDRVNNVLGLTLDNPVPGNYTIKVSGYNVPQGPQPYSLVINGEIGTEINLPFIPLLLLNN